MQYSSLIFPYIFLIIFIIVFILFLFVFGKIIIQFITSYKNQSYHQTRNIIRKTMIFCDKNRILILTVLTNIIILSSFIFNLGWYRYFFAIPILIHVTLFSYLNYKLYLNSFKSNIRDFFITCNFLLINIGYILLPDLSDDSSYAFWGILRDVPAIDILMTISILLIILNIIVMILLWFLSKRIVERKF